MVYQVLAGEDCSMEQGVDLHPEGSALPVALEVDLLVVGDQQELLLVLVEQLVKVVVLHLEGLRVVHQEEEVPHRAVLWVVGLRRELVHRGVL